MREIIKNILKKYNGKYYIGKEDIYRYYIYANLNVFNRDLILDIEEKFNKQWYVTETFIKYDCKFTKKTCIVIRKL